MPGASGSLRFGLLLLGPDPGAGDLEQFGQHEEIILAEDVGPWYRGRPRDRPHRAGLSLERPASPCRKSQPYTGGSSLSTT